MSTTTRNPQYHHIEPLNRDNYDTWAIQAKAILVKNDLWDAIGEEKPDAGKDLLARSELFLMISPKELRQVKNCKSASEIWTKIKSIYQSEGPAKKATLLKQLILKKMTDSDDVQDHMAAIFFCVDRLENMDIKINDDLLSIIILYSLPSSFENFRIAIETRDKLPLPEDLKIKIIEESLARKRNKNHNAPSESAYYFNKKKLKCTICDKVGHQASKCWSRNKNQSSNSSSDNNKKKSNAKNLFIAETANTIHADADNVWCLDSGCTSHMTGQPGKFQNIESEQGKLKLASNQSTEIKVGLLYCPPNVTLGEVWVDHGISQCFMETFSAILIGGFLMIFGVVQINVYFRYSTEVVDVRSSRLFGVQLFFTLFIPVLAVIRFLLQAFLFDGGHIYGYMIVGLVTTIIVFPLSAYLVILERRHLLPSVPPLGHGFVLLVFWAMIFVSENLAFLNLNKEGWWWHLKNLQDRLEMALFVGRYVSCMIMFILGMKAPGITHQFASWRLEDEEYSRRNPRDENRSTFRNAFSKLRTLLPFLWPKKSPLLQFYVFISVLTLLAGRVINLFVPIYNKYIVDSLTDKPLEFRWDLVVIYVFFKFLQGGGTGGMGFLNNLRSFLWIKVEQYTTREMQLELFRHLHDLPLKWHLSRKTGEVLRVMDRGTDSIDNLLSYILFSITPTLVDILIAVVFFITQFNAWFGLIVFSTMVLYIIATIAVTEWRTKFQRRMNLADNEQKARSVDSLLNYETVKYYGAESYEVHSYKGAIQNFQKEEFKSLVTLNMLNTLQNIIICSGLIAGSLLCVSMVVKSNKLTVGDYVLFASYIVQLYVPLNWFGTYYRAIQKNFVDMENMFDLMRVDSDVKDATGAPDLVIHRGAVEFKHVSFGYGPERLILNNVSFKIAPGSTVALVGPSGAGKSTIMRLLFRFYDVNEGAVLVDGQDVRTVTQASLRATIGVVPQDTVLFNNTVRYNIQYGRLEAPSADVISAAKNADIHDRILTFPDAYDTMVGERGLRLSGGEKQRIAIARTLLKDPSIVLLDEATSALDTNTERNIQAALSRVCVNRTTLIIAHRLSTIIHADEILVLKEGEIIERGNHETLLSNGGVYASMWQQQLENKTSTDEGSNGEGNDANESEPNGLPIAPHGHGN